MIRETPEHNVLCYTVGSKQIVSNPPILAIHRRLCRTNNESMSLFLDVAMLYMFWLQICLQYPTIRLYIVRLIKNIDKSPVFFLGGGVHLAKPSTVRSSSASSKQQSRECESCECKALRLYHLSSTVAHGG